MAALPSLKWQRCQFSEGVPHRMDRVDISSPFSRTVMHRGEIATGSPRHEPTAKAMRNAAAGSASIFQLAPLPANDIRSGNAANKSDRGSFPGARQKGDLLHVRLARWHPPGTNASPQTTGARRPSAQVLHREAELRVRHALQDLIGLHKPFCLARKNIFWTAGSCELPY